MTGANATDTLGTLVTEHPELARELERLGLDYCCGGDRSLEGACRDAGLDALEVTAALNAQDSIGPAAWATMSPIELVDHLEATHHAYLHAELPRLAALAKKVTEVHGERHPELTEIGDTLVELRTDLEPHLEKEERVLFPMIRELMATETAPTFHCGSLANPISVMLVEHDRVGELLSRLREFTDGYTTPADGCASYEAFSRGLAELEADTHLHIHKENNLLFPAVTERERTQG
jgi:regulator of cell morphogenesis and NO signaling